MISQDKTSEELLAEIERLRAKVGKMEFLMRSTEDTCLACAIKLEVIDQQAARIQELEDAHKRSGAKYAKIINELRSSVYANIPGLDVGKIGPDAAKPQSWQITEERKKAVCAMTKILAAIGCQSCHNYIQKYYSNHIAVLRAMLREAEQCE